MSLYSSMMKDYVFRRTRYSTSSKHICYECIVPNDGYNCTPYDAIPPHQKNMVYGRDEGITIFINIKLGSYTFIKVRVNFFFCIG